MFFPGQRVASRSLLDAERCVPMSNSIMPSLANIPPAGRQKSCKSIATTEPQPCRATSMHSNWSLTLSLWRPRSAIDSCRDEVAERGMLRIAMDVLLRVHDRVFEALSTPPTRAPDGRPVYAPWEVPHILQLERSEVRRMPSGLD